MIGSLVAVYLTLVTATLSTPTALLLTGIIADIGVSGAITAAKVPNGTMVVNRAGVKPTVKGFILASRVTGLLSASTATIPAPKTATAAKRSGAAKPEAVLISITKDLVVSLAILILRPSNLTKPWLWSGAVATILDNVLALKTLSPSIKRAKVITVFGLATPGAVKAGAVLTYTLASIPRTVILEPAALNRKPIAWTFFAPVTTVAEIG
ncbi:MAG: hypothetical protein DDT30_01827 [Dehalococcoidia bacterium]|nr:hypothetical protein [Bacillota bacterium]